MRSGGIVIAASEGERTTASVATWVIRLALVIATFALLRYGSRLISAWDLRRKANFSFDPGGWWRALLVFILAGIVFAVAARFPFPRPRYAWGRIAIALVILIPPLHVTFLFGGPVPPAWANHFWWFDSIVMSQLAAVLAGVAIGCGFGARRAAPP